MCFEEPYRLFFFGTSFVRRRARIAPKLGSAIGNVGHPLKFADVFGWPFFVFLMRKNQNEKEYYQRLPPFFHQWGQIVSNAFSIASVSSGVKKLSMASTIAGYVSRNWAV